MFLYINRKKYNRCIFIELMFIYFSLSLLNNSVHISVTIYEKHTSLDPFRDSILCLHARTSYSMKHIFVKGYTNPNVQLLLTTISDSRQFKWRSLKKLKVFFILTLEKQLYVDLLKPRNDFVYITWDLPFTKVCSHCLRVTRGYSKNKNCSHVNHAGRSCPVSDLEGNVLVL